MEGDYTKKEANLSRRKFIDLIGKASLYTSILGIVSCAEKKDNNASPIKKEQQIEQVSIGWRDKFIEICTEYKFMARMNKKHKNS